MQPEARFKSALRRSFKERFPSGLWTHIVKGPGMITGMPDLLIGALHQHVYLEAKVDTLLVRPTQRSTFDKLTSCGVRIVVLAQLKGVLRLYTWPSDPAEAGLVPHYSNLNFWSYIL